MPLLFLSLFLLLTSHIAQQTSAINVTCPLSSSCCVDRFLDVDIDSQMDIQYGSGEGIESTPPRRGRVSRNTASSSVALYMDAYFPRSLRNVLKPVMICIHGGAFLPRSDKRAGNTVSECRAWARRGFLGLSIEYRRWNGVLGDSDIRILTDPMHDTLAAVRFVSKEYINLGADPTRIALSGTSAGAITISNTMIFDIGEGASGNEGYPSNVTLGISMSGGTSVHLINTTRKTADEISPLLLLHTREDRTVPYNQSVDTKTFLDSVGVPNELITVVAPTPSQIHTPPPFTTLGRDNQWVFGDMAGYVMNYMSCDEVPPSSDPNAAVVEPVCFDCQNGSYCRGDNTMVTCPSLVYNGQILPSISSLYLANSVMDCVCPLGSYVVDDLETTNTTANAACRPCGEGFYCLPRVGAQGRFQCPGTSPGAVYTGTELATTATACKCNTNHFRTAGNQTCQPCPADSDTRGQVHSTCVCLPRFFGTLSGNGTLSSCSMCPVGSYCSGNNSATTCPSGRTSPQGSRYAVECKCFNGTEYRGPDGECITCPSHTFCINEQIFYCPYRSTHVVKNDLSFIGCVCENGYILTQNTTDNQFQCDPCGIGAFCLGNVKTQCGPGQTTSTDTASNSSACKCRSGFIPQGLTCGACDSNSYCPDGISAIQCPLNRFSQLPRTTLSDCVCIDGYYSIYATITDCVVCPSGFYCTGSAPIACPAESSSLPASTQQGDCICNTFFGDVDPAPGIVLCRVKPSVLKGRHARQQVVHSTNRITGCNEFYTAGTPDTVFCRVDRGPDRSIPACSPGMQELSCKNIIELQIYNMSTNNMIRSFSASERIIVHEKPLYSDPISTYTIMHSRYFSIDDDYWLDTVSIAGHKVSVFQILHKFKWTENLHSVDVMHRSDGVITAFILYDSYNDNYEEGSNRWLVSVLDITAAVQTCRSTGVPRSSFSRTLRSFSVGVLSVPTQPVQPSLVQWLETPPASQIFSVCAAENSLTSSSFMIIVQRTILEYSISPFGVGYGVEGLLHSCDLPSTQLVGSNPGQLLFVSPLVYVRFDRKIMSMDMASCAYTLIDTPSSVLLERKLALGVDDTGTSSLHYVTQTLSLNPLMSPTQNSVQLTTACRHCLNAGDYAAGNALLPILECTDDAPDDPNEALERVCRTFNTTFNATSMTTANLTIRNMTQNMTRNVTQNVTHNATVSTPPPTSAPQPPQTSAPPPPPTSAQTPSNNLSTSQPPASTSTPMSTPMSTPEPPPTSSPTSEPPPSTSPPPPPTPPYDFSEVEKRIAIARRVQPDTIDREPQVVSDTRDAVLGSKTTALFNNITVIVLLAVCVLVAIFASNKSHRRRKRR
jgi:hypothetical protein